MSTFTVKMQTGDIECRKEFILNEAPSCPDWSTLLWGIPTLMNVGAGTSYFTPNAIAGATWTCGATCPNAAVDSGLAFNTGTLIYNGPACNAQITTHVVKACNPLDFLSVNTMIIVRSAMFGFLPINGIAPFYDYSAYAPGTYDEVLPFTLPNTLGLNDTIDFLTINAQIPSGIPVVGLGMAIDITATISNV